MSPADIKQKPKQQGIWSNPGGMVQHNGQDWREAGRMRGGGPWGSVLTLSVLLALGLWLWPVAGFSQLFPDLGGQRTGTATAQFLKIGVGARAMGMGEAFVAVANDAEALYWNPAGIARAANNAVLFAHVQWLVDVQLEYAGLVYHLNPLNSVGVSVTYLHTGEMNETTELQPFGTGRKFGFGDFLLGVTYAREMTNKFSFGFTAKWMQETLAELTTRAFLFDIGTYYYTGWRSFRFAVSVTNLGANMSPGGSFRYQALDGEFVEVRDFQDFAPPIMFRIGLGGELIDTPQHRLTAAIQLNHPNDNVENLNLGAEYWWQNTLALRAGIITARAEQDVSAGFGLNLPLQVTRARLDYAWSNFGRLGSVSRFSLQLLF